MEVIIKDNKLVIVAEPKTIHFDLPNYVGNNLKHEIHFVIKYNEFSAEHTIKKKLSSLLPKHKNGNYIHKHGKQ